MFYDPVGASTASTQESKPKSLRATHYPSRPHLHHQQTITLPLTQLLNALLSLPPLLPVRPPTFQEENFSPWEENTGLLYPTHCLYYPSDLADQRGWPWTLASRPVLNPRMASVALMMKYKAPPTAHESACLVWIWNCFLADTGRSSLALYSLCLHARAPPEWNTCRLPFSLCLRARGTPPVCPTHLFSPESKLAHGTRRCSMGHQLSTKKPGFQLSA